MTHEEAFLADIIESPDDDTPRLIYADWLDDHGQAERAEFVRVQIELEPHRFQIDRPRVRELLTREAELLQSYEDAWLGPLRPLLCRWTFRRGFLDEVVVPAAIYMSQGPISCPATVRRVEVDLGGFESPQDAIEFIPESVAFENVLLPIGFRGRTLVLAMQDPREATTRETLEFILNRSIETVAAPTEQLVAAISRHYGQMENESVDSVLLDYAEPVIDSEADRASVGMPRFTIDIGQNAYHSADGGTTWTRSFREAPGRHTPVVRGEVDLSRLPPRPAGAFWDFVTVLPCGFGVAVGHQTINEARRLADVFITEDGGRRWQEQPVRRTGGWDARSWPVEQFESLALRTPADIALAWEDPWLLEGSQSHVVCSRDRGKSWEYRCLGESNPYLARDHGGRLLALNDGFYLESHDRGRTWGRRAFAVEWPVHYCHQRVALLRNVMFPAPGLGYALVVHWRRESGSERPPEVGLLTTTDDGSRWKHLHVFEGPNIGDVNERHVLGLRVE